MIRARCTTACRALVRAANLASSRRRRWLSRMHWGDGRGIQHAYQAPLTSSRAATAGTDFRADVLVRQASQEIRTLSHLLHPPLLDEVGLVPALEWFVQGFSERSGIRVGLSISPDLGRLSREAETTVFRIVQESLTNIHRHSGSTTASIRLQRAGGIISLSIGDQGCGLQSSALQSSEKRPVLLLGVGISGMRQRVLQLGGTFTLSSTERGTLVEVSLPA